MNSQLESNFSFDYSLRMSELINKPLKNIFNQNIKANCTCKKCKI